MNTEPAFGNEVFHRAGLSAVQVSKHGGEVSGFRKMVDELGEGFTAGEDTADSRVFMVNHGSGLLSSSAGRFS